MSLAESDKEKERNTKLLFFSLTKITPELVSRNLKEGSIIHTGLHSVCQKKWLLGGKRLESAVWEEGGRHYYPLSRAPYIACKESRAKVLVVNRKRG